MSPWGVSKNLDWNGYSVRSIHAGSDREAVIGRPGDEES